MPQFDNASDDDIGAEDKKYYARVFDLLNWSMENNLLPVPIDITSICHKGMETHYKNTNSASDINPTETWPNLDEICHKKLHSASRISASCIEIPGIIVITPHPPLKVNNPCRLQYRMVDGAHRICLRKYLLTLLTQELEELEQEPGTHDNSLQLQIQEKQKLINQASTGFFLVMNQTTFQSMLMSSDPRMSWAKSNEHLMKDVTEELQLKWKQWMSRVMNHVWQSNGYHFGDESRDSRVDAQPIEEL